jgi:hypothetical protein
MVNTARAAWKPGGSPGQFMFFLPPEMQPIAARPIDSASGSYRSEACELTYDYGRYSDPLDNQEKPAYSELWRTIDGHRAKTVTFIDPDQAEGLTAIAAIHFPDLGHLSRLTIVLACRDGGDLDEAEAIFGSVVFSQP